MNVFVKRVLLKELVIQDEEQGTATTVTDAYLIENCKEIFADAVEKAGKSWNEEKQPLQINVSDGCLYLYAEVESKIDFFIPAVGG